MDTQKLDQAYIANTYARFPVTIVKGKGSLVWDDTGKEYIDLSTGIAVDIFGVADEEWVAAVTKQLGTLQHISNLYYTEPCAKLAQMLCEKTGMKKVFFGNSGAEANECAIKAARKWSEEKKGKEYATIITLKNSFHGRTITTLAATGQDVFHHDFTPLTEGFVYAEPNDLADLEQLIKTNKCAAVMMEVVQGEGGVMPLDETYVKGAAKLCEEYDLLLICDEVQVGNGRSGKLYGYMHYGIQPDIVSTAKGLAGGLPLGAAGGILLVDGHALFVGAAAQFTDPLPQFGGGDIKNVQAGTERQHHHHEIRRRTPAEQQQIAAQQGTDGTAAQPGMDAVLIALRYHAGRRDVGGDLGKDDDGAAGKHQPQHQLEHLADEVFAPCVEDGQIADRCAQHEAAAAEQAEQYLVQGLPDRAALHKGQHDEQQARKQGAQPCGHPLLCPALSPRRCASCGRFSFFLCHLSLQPCLFLP